MNEKNEIKHLQFGVYFNEHLEALFALESEAEDFSYILRKNLLKSDARGTIEVRGVV